MIALGLVGQFEIFSGRVILPQICICILLFASLVSFSNSAAPTRLLTENWAPMSFQESGEPQGFMVDLVGLLRSEFRLPADEIEVLPWARGYAIAQSSPNVMLFATSVNPQRRKLFDFVGPVATTSVYLYASVDDPININSLSDIAAEDAVGVYRDSIGESILEKVDDVNLLVASFPHQSARQLVRKRVRLWSQADVAVAMLLAEVGSDVSEVRPVFKLGKIELYFAFSAGTDKSVVEAWHQALQSVQQSGQFAELYQQWFHNLTPPDDAEILWRQ